MLRMRLFYHVSPSASTSHRSSPRRAHLPPLPWSYGDIRKPKNENPSMLPLLSSPCLHIFSPALSERSITSSRAVLRLRLTPRPRATHVLPSVRVETRSV